MYHSLSKYVRETEAVKALSGAKVLRYEKKTKKHLFFSGDPIDPPKSYTLDLLFMCPCTMGEITDQLCSSTPLVAYELHCTAPSTFT